MTEMKANGDPRARSSSSSDPRDGSVLLRAPHRPDLGSFRKETVVEAIDLSLDGLLYPQSSDDDEEKEEEEEEEPKAYLPEEEEAEGAQGASSPTRGSAADKDALDRVLDTFLAPADSPPAAWPIFASEIPELMNHRRPPDGKAGTTSCGPAALPPPPPPWKAAKDADGAVYKSPAGKGAAPADACEGQPGLDAEGAAAASNSSLGPGAPSAPAELLNVPPLLPLNSAYLAARTRQLLDGEEEFERGGGAFGGPPQARLLPSPPELAHYLCAPNAGDFQPGLRIKEESLPAAAPLALALPCVDYAQPKPAAGGPHDAAAASLEAVLYKAEAAAAASAGGSYGPVPCKVSAGCIVPRDSLSLPSTSSAAPPALYPPLALQGPSQLAFPPAGLKDSFPQLYPPYLSYIRSDAEAGQSPQYTFESFSQKICLICGDEASGCHYGVLTCGSCKVFFKRAMEGQHNYLCAGRNDCIVDKIRRKNCPACRLRKCCQAGMVLGGRKFKKFNKVKVLRTLDVVALQQPVALPNDSQALAQRLSFSPHQEIQFIPPLVGILQGIEPEVVYAGYDNTQPETPSALLTSLNQLCERQLLCVVKWSKSLPGFRNLHIDDQITLIQYSWMSLMVFAMGWRSYKHVSGQMLYFAPDLILNEQRMKESSFYSQCLSMWQIPQEFVKLQVSQEEFLCMKALLLLSTIPLEGLRSQAQFEEMRSSYIRELVKAIGLRQKGVVASSQRFYQLTRLMDSMHDLVKQLHLYCLNTFLQSRALSVEFPEMMSEVIAAQLPKILAGMVKPLLFHKK
ncbi:progesterone receptor [Eublepharis macularius]|uniref:Progesterone receptor n=1 Tax=Eublepharis macularius TaxID=481883 RepID=A0AA97KSJ9_EUBMA|nr:progesterone receptor [Eublepharis macularius]